MPQTPLNNQNKSVLTQSPALKKKAAINSVGWFAHIFLRHYFTHRTPKFHFEIYRDLQNDESGFIQILGFRGSAKSTIASLAFPLWAAITGKKKFIIIISDSFSQAKLIIKNIIAELENNDDLKSYFGPFKGKEEWTATNIVLRNGVRIMAKSRGQKVRGLRHLEHRPDLIICDDIENHELVRTKEQRDKTEEWFLSDVVPSLDSVSGKMVVVGSMLHADSLMARLKQRMEADKMGITKQYPIYMNDFILWPSKYPIEKIDEIRRDVGARYFLREYLLKIVPEEGQVIKSVQYYSQLPEIIKIGIAVDLAISQKQSADNSAINAISLGKDGKFYNLKSLAGKWSFNDTLAKINEVYTSLKNIHKVPVYLGIEDVAYQKAAIEEMIRRYKLPVKSIKVTNDKRARLQAIEPYFESGQIFFRNEDGDVVNEILNFGIEQYDDRMDAFIHSLNLILKVRRPDIIWV